MPWLTYLKRRVNSRIFQDLNVLGVLDKIYKGDHGGLATYEFRTSKSYPPENYIVQSQKDMVTTVLNNQDTLVHGPHQTNTVSKGFHVTKVKKHIETTAETAHIHDTAKTNIEVTAQTEHVHVKAKTNVELTAETEHIHLTATTDITLQVGSSKIEMKADGTITISGVNVNVIGSARIDLNS